MKSVVRIQGQGKVKDAGLRGITRHGYFGSVDFRVPGEPGSEQSDKQERELVAGRNFRSHTQILRFSFSDLLASSSIVSVASLQPTLLPPLSSVHVGPSYHHSNVLPAFATIAELAISEANRTITVPLADGMMTPSMIAMFPARAEVALQPAGIS